MYTIFKNNKRTVRKTFATYEQARQYARKLVRKLTHDDFWRVFSTNPPINEYGYSVRKI